ncbi:NUDIX domain-containing protein [Staphylococcus delphini]|nr:NUDIX domain-containing protein [Staphylococcus delphini]
MMKKIHNSSYSSKEKCHHLFIGGCSMCRNKLIPAVYIVIEQDGHQLYLRRKNTGYEDGKLSLPAGHIEKGETPYQAAMRESFEELNIVVAPEALEIKHVCYRYEENRIDYYLKVKHWTGNIINHEPHKCSELIWLHRPNDEVIDVVKQCIQHMHQNILFSDSKY